jgi:pyrroloquinoline quinone biosynthesis protein D
MSAIPDMPRLNRRFRMQWEEAQQAHVLLYPEGMVRLNQSAGEILKRCDGATTVDDIVAQLEQQFNASGLRDDVLGLLSHAMEKDWIA